MTPPGRTILFINDDLACTFPFLTNSSRYQDFTILEFNHIIISGVHVLPTEILDRFDGMLLKNECWMNVVGVHI
jgi:hypothetical protein